MVRGHYRECKGALAVLLDPSRRTQHVERSHDVAQTAKGGRPHPSACDIRLASVDTLVVGALAQLLRALLAHLQPAVQVPQGNSRAAAESLLVECVAGALAASQA